MPRTRIAVAGVGMVGQTPIAIVIAIANGIELGCRRWKIQPRQNSAPASSANTTALHNRP